MERSQKKAMAEGRADSAVVKHYLELLEAMAPRRGRQRTIQSIDKRLGEIQVELQGAAPLKRVHLEQERMNLEVERELRTSTKELAEAEKGFIKVGRAYAERKGLTYSAFRAVGVPPQVLKKANISR